RAGMERRCHHRRGGPRPLPAALHPLARADLKDRPVVLIHGIDPERVQAAVFDLGGVFLAGGPDAVAAFGSRHGVTDDAWRAMRRELFSETGMWSAVERGQCRFDA